MSTPSKEHSRADRLREYAATVELGGLTVAAMGALVRGREARAWAPDEPPEVVFAQTLVDDRALPAAVWVALRRDDAAGALEAMTAASQTSFLVSSREEMGEGYRLQTVEEVRPLPEVTLLLAQLSAMLGIPEDVVRMVGEWGADDPRMQLEIDQLLDRRFGPVGELAPAQTPVPVAGLTMTVAETVAVLRLTPAQAKALETLVHRVGVTITA